MIKKLHFTCSVISDCVLTTSLGVNSDFARKISISPNPTTGFIHIDLGEIYNKISTSIYDVNGRLLQNKNHTATNSINLNIDLPPSTYIIRIESDEHKKASYRLIVE